MTDWKRSLNQDRTEAIGFNANIGHNTDDINVGEVLKQALPEDFIKYGMIPEFMGRVLSMFPWISLMKTRL